MDETTFRILDVLSRHPSGLISINELTTQIQSAHGSAHYKNIYDKTQELAKQGLLSITIAGRSSLISLAFSNYFLRDFLASMEFEKKRRFLEKKPAYRILLEELEKQFWKREYCFLEWICLLGAEKNAKLNSADLFFFLGNPGWGEEAMEKTKRIFGICHGIQNRFSIKINPLVLTEHEFLELTQTTEQNQAKRLLYSQIAFFKPEAFWTEIKNTLSRTPIFTQRKELNPAKTAKADLESNLLRLGYREIGSTIREADPICLESIITTIVIQGDARKTEAIPALIEKSFGSQRPICYPLLIFLCHKFNELEKLFGQLKAYQKIKPNPQTAFAIQILESLKIKEKKANEKEIKQKMMLYAAH